MAASDLRRLVERHLHARGWIVLSLLFNLPYVIFRLQRTAFDTYTHLFFADHYRQDWWSLWEPRWYLGFSVASYPPLIHQVIALLSRPLGALVAAFAPEPELYPGAFCWVGAEVAYVLVLLAVLCAFPLAVREFARLFVGPRAADWAATLAVCLPSLHLSAWAFGQLPTLAATAVMLFALARGAKFVRTGRPLALMQAVALAALTGAAHHAVFLFAPFGGAAIIARVIRRAQLLPSLSRAVVWAALSALAVAAVLWPFLAWSHAQIGPQTPIDHASRYNFLLQPQATLFFFWPVYGPLLLMIPAAIWLTRGAPRLWPLALAFGVLFTLSLGGTTPLPRWLFGAGWEWLTYDRFGLWASLTLLPFAGATLLCLLRQPRRWARWTALGFVAAMAAASVIAGWLSVIAQAQPPALDLTPIIRFLNEPAQRPYRYLTLGFGDQFAKLSGITQNGTPDGAYHTARELPELRASGLGALDGAVWSLRGEWALTPFLSQPGRYGLRWVFSNHPRYTPLLRATGWTYRFDVGEVQAWERADVEPRAVVPPAEDRRAAMWWGTAPLTALALAALAMAWPLRARLTRAWLAHALSLVRRGLFMLTVALLSLWWAHLARGGDLPHLYFAYQSILVFASDAALGLTLSVWVVECALRGAPLRVGPRAMAWAGLAFIGACALSARNSADPALTLAFTAHLGLLAGMYVMLVNDPPQARIEGWLFGIVIAAQGALALIQVLTQSTAIPRELYLWWPGQITAAMPGASVVMNAQGQRWLRAYGTLPHPNVLGAMLLVYLGGVAAQFVTSGQRRWLGFVALGGAALALTFSRAAWLGLGAMLITALGLIQSEARSRLRLAASTSALMMAATLIPLTPFLLSRLNINAPANALELSSTSERARLVEYGLQAWQAQPLTGVGAGVFVQWAARHTDQRFPSEPVHNLPLLVLSETGVIGGAAALALLGAIVAEARRRQFVVRYASSAEAVWAAVLLGAFVAGLFDHVWWTQPPARTLIVAALAFWAARHQ